MTDAIALASGLLLPWLLGIAAIVAIRRAAEPGEANGEIAWIIGAGYFVGMFALTLWMRVLSLIHVRFSVLAIALPLTIVALLLGWIALRRNRLLVTSTLRDALRAFFATPGLTRGWRFLWWGLIAWLALRFALLALEVTWRPLYPWDAWIQWATKARVWYGLGYIAPFARVGEWFLGNGAYYFDASPEYPPTVPLLQVWASLLLGRWDDALMNWPWWQIAVALAFAVYGALRRLDATPLTALVATFMVSSVPLANVHVALAGYADLPLAAYFTVAVLAFLCWNKTRRVHDGVLALFLLSACTQLKNPGIFWAMTVIPGVLVAALPRHGLKLAGIAFGMAILLLAVLAQTNVAVFQYRLHLDFDPAWRQLGESFFLLGNWNLLWYAVIGIVILVRKQLLLPPLVPFTTIIVGGLLFLFMVFGFTNAREWMAQQTTVNRATLHLVPIIAIYIVVAFQAFAARWVAAHPAPAAPSPTGSTVSPLSPASISPAPIAVPATSPGAG